MSPASFNDCIADTVLFVCVLRTDKRPNGDTDMNRKTPEENELVQSLIFFL